MVFSQKKIYLVIALTVISLVGIVVVQYFWIDAAYKTQKEQFDRRLNNIGGEINKSLQSDTELRNSMMVYANNSVYPSMRSIIYGLPKSFSYVVLENDSTLANGDTLLPKSTLQHKIRTKLDSVFAENNLDIAYEFGLINHNPCDGCGAGKEFVIFSSMDNHDLSPIKTTNYKTSASALMGFGHLSIYFPNKGFFIAKQIGWMLALSILAIVIIVGCFGYTILTIRKQKRLAEMKNDFINNMTHEFKTPIFSISLASKALRKVKEVQESPKVQKYLSLIDDENKRLKNQVNKVLQMALVDSEESRINKEQVDIHTLIKGVANSFDLKLEEQNGSIDLQLNASNHLIEADQTHLSNIFHSLIDNAIKYTEEQPRITITTEDKEGGVCFRITDNGIGMDPQAQENIFDKFYRAQSGDRHDVKGFGLGLSYVKNIVEAHQGWIKLRSKLNQGSTFTIFLPA